MFTYIGNFYFRCVATGITFYVPEGPLAPITVVSQAYNAAVTQLIG